MLSTRRLISQWSIEVSIEGQNPRPKQIKLTLGSVGVFPLPGGALWRASEGTLLPLLASSSVVLVSAGLAMAWTWAYSFRGQNIVALWKTNKTNINNSNQMTLSSSPEGLRTFQRPNPQTLSAHLKIQLPDQGKTRICCK